MSSPTLPKGRPIAIANRELRYVPTGWSHPRDKTGCYIPLYSRPRHKELEGEIADRLVEGDVQIAQDVLDEYMPDFSDVPEDQLGVCAYETSTEGTPISPVFPNTPDGRFALAKYCSEHETIFATYQASIQTWVQVLFGDHRALVDIKSGRVILANRVIAG
jgi:hypothetical protein